MPPVTVLSNKKENDAVFNAGSVDPFMFVVFTMFVVIAYLSVAKDLSKTGAILCGAGMIFLAGLFAYHVSLGAYLSNPQYRMYPRNQFDVA
ncbi:hypothetical protein [Herbaspirillum sp. CAH-3]|uniref:hypothetical protein n=1 Tax=Herbaspirillum sp. CAH-3 TaxID=2605746 RepID=UPI0012AD1CAB|nr:hypothetical protein [Herbaspirillum sp. CAH-3]MRT30430.1 hypothetical protein [Herbaspirillum sp. CAH-3]